MENTRKFNATITTRYGLPEKEIYQQVIDLVKKNNLPKSRAQLLLVERGLVHIKNPEPLIKEKVVYKDTPPIEKGVYKDRPVEKKVYVDRPVEKKVYVNKPLDKPFHKAKPEPDHHIVDTELVQENKKEQPPSVDKLKTGDKVNFHIALEEKKLPKKSSGVGGWIALIAMFVGVPLTGYLINKFTSK